LKQKKKELRAWGIDIEDKNESVAMPAFSKQKQERFLRQLRRTKEEFETSHAEAKSFI
jgi:hypothetical protein